MPRETLPRKFGREVGAFASRARRTLATFSSADNIFDMNAIYDFCAPVLGLGLEPKELTFLQISLRAVIVFL